MLGDRGLQMLLSKFKITNNNYYMLGMGVIFIDKGAGNAVKFKTQIDKHGKLIRSRITQIPVTIKFYILLVCSS